MSCCRRIGRIDFSTFAATYVFACVLGIASNAPGGIGVFEAAMIKVVPVTSEAELLASLLLFRVIYYLIPFVLALAFIGAHEDLPALEELARSHDPQRSDDPQRSR